MSDMLHYIQEEAQKRVSTVPWLHEMQNTALAKLEQHGFPTRHHEEWKYTLVYGLLNESYVPLTSCDDVITHQLAILNEAKVISCHLPKGVLVMPLSLAITEYEDLVRPYLGKILESTHGFQWANTALIHQGLFVYIPEGVEVAEPIVLNHQMAQPNQAMHLRHLIIAERGSQAVILESYAGTQDQMYLMNTVTEIFLAPRANLTHYKIQRESKAAYHIGHVAVKQSKRSQFSSHALSVGAKLMRSDIQINLQGENGQCLLNGLYAPGEGQHMDHHTTIRHLVANCRSEQDYKGILNGRSRAVFNGKVIVAPNAQHTDATQQNKNLLLSAHAEIDTKPQLEIFADDVLCSHGATVGQLDEDALFYMATRGIDSITAAHFLIHAFTIDNLRLIPQRELADWMSDLVSEQVEVGL